jgi:hypothetical protein
MVCSKSAKICMKKISDDLHFFAGEGLEEKNHFPQTGGVADEWTDWHPFCIN